MGTAFGVHRAFDTAGAVLGPFVAFLILRAAPTGYDAVFVISFLFALIGLGVLVLFVQNRHENKHKGGATWRGVVNLFTRDDFRTLVIVGAMFGFFTIADASIYITFQNRTLFETSYFPLLYVGTSISYLVLAIPIGNLADRVGRTRVFITGYVLLFVVYLVLLAPAPGGLDLVAILALLGTFYACTDGVLIAMASTVIPRRAPHQWNRGAHDRGRVERHRGVDRMGRVRELVGPGDHGEGLRRAPRRYDDRRCDDAPGPQPALRLIHRRSAARDLSLRGRRSR